MSNIILKRSSVADKVPLTTELQLGELAVNTFDGKMFMKKNNGADSIVSMLTSADIDTTVQSVVLTATTLEMEAGTETAPRLMSPAQVKTASETVVQTYTGMFSSGLFSG